MSEFKKGDKVRRLTSLDTLPGEEMNAGDIYTVSHVSAGGYNLFLTDAKYPHLGYSVIEFEKVEEENMRNTKVFKVGDTVRRTSGSWFGVNKGDVCVVSEVFKDGRTIELKGHHPVTFDATRFELVEAAPNDLDAALRENLRALEQQVSALRKQIRATHVLLTAEKEKK